MKFRAGLNKSQKSFNQPIHAANTAFGHETSTNAPQPLDNVEGVETFERMSGPGWFWQKWEIKIGNKKEKPRHEQNRPIEPFAQLNVLIDSSGLPLVTNASHTAIAAIRL